MTRLRATRPWRGPLTSKPTWSHTFGCLITSAFFVSGAPDKAGVRRPGVEHSEGKTMSTLGLIILIVVLVCCSAGVAAIIGAAEDGND